MAAGKKEIQALITLAGKVDPSLQKALKTAQGETSKLTKSAQKSASGISGVGDVVKGVLGGNLLTNAITNVVSKVKEFGAQGVELASDLTEVQNVVDTTFGKSSTQINKWSQTALEAYGLSELQAKQYTGTLGAMMKSSGITGQSLIKMSENLSGLSGDFASFYNLAQDDAFEKVRAGLSGETEPLKQLGINMSVANMEAFALSKGITTSYSKMDQASQTMLRYSYLMSVSKDAQGDFAKTLQTSYANQKRLFTTKINQTVAKLAVNILPALTKGLEFTNKLIDRIDTSKISAGFSQITGKIYGFLPAIKGASKGISGLLMNDLNFFKTQGLKIFNGLAPSITKLVQSVLPFVTKAFDTFSKNVVPLVMKIESALVDTLVPNIAKAFDFIRTTVMPPAMEVFSFFADVIIPKVASIVQQWMPTIQAIIGNTFNLIIEIAKTLMEAFVMIWPFISNIISVAVAEIGGVINGLLTILNGVIEFVTGVFTGNWSQAWQGVKDIFGGIFSTLGAVLKAPINGIIGLLNIAIRGINKLNITVPDWVPGIGGKSFGVDIPEIPTFARGGFADQPSVFGEAGLEAAIPIRYKDPRSLSLLNKTAQAIGADQGGSTPTISLSFNFNGPVSNKDDVTEGVKMAKDYIIGVMEEYFDDRGRTSFA